MLAGWTLALLVGLMGAIVGSYLGTIVTRWPVGRSANEGRSACDGCGRRLAWHELVPLVSALAFRGRCRTCGTGIDAVHPLAELAAALLPALGALLLPLPAALAFALFVWLLVPLALLDARHFWLPDRLVLALAVVGLLAGGALGLAALHERLIGGAAGFGLLWLMTTGYRRFRGHEGMGRGDAKLLGAIGLWTGWQALPFILAGAAAFGLVWYLALGLAGRAGRGAMLPLGTCLALAAAMTALLK